MSKKGPRARASAKRAKGLLPLFPPLPGQPVHSALQVGYCQTFEQLRQLVEKAKSKTGEEGVTLAPEVYRLAKELAELASWFCPPAKPRPDLETIEIANRAAQAGWSASEALDLAKKSQNRPRGRPITKRLVAVHCYELHLTNPQKWSWMRLAQKYCDCGAAQHEEKCSGRIQRQVRHLKLLLRKHSLE